MHRRSFLFGTSALLMSQLLVGCDASNKLELNVQVLKGSIPGRILNEFQESLSEKPELRFSPVLQLRELFKRLESLSKENKSVNNSGWFNIPWLFGNSQPSETDLVSLGDFWLKEAIEKNLIQTLSADKLENWSKLSPKWQELVTRNNQGLVDKQGKIWAAPYRWGSTVIIYRRDKLEKFDWKLQDWSDLWREELQGRISLLNQPREVIGLTLKKLGKSYNTEDLEKEAPTLEEELKALNKQVKFYDSTSYLEPLIIGDTWLAVGWSNDVVPILSRYRQLNIVVPSSGTALWADLWVKPSGKDKQDLSNKWIDFCWQPEIGKQIALLTKGNSPIFPDIKKSEIPQFLQKLLLTNRQVFDKSEFLLPLSQSSIKQYENLFNQMKSR